MVQGGGQDSKRPEGDTPLSPLSLLLRRVREVLEGRYSPSGLFVLHTIACSKET